MNRYVVFFDLDHTLLNTSSGRLFVKYLFHNNLIGWEQLLQGLFVGFFHRFGLINAEKIITRWAMKCKGLSEKNMIEFSQKWFKDDVINYFRGYVVEEMNNHKKREGRVVILSAATPYICNPIKEYLEMDYVISTELEVMDGLFTGKLLGNFCYGMGKLKKAIEYCNSNGFEMEKAFYYADSFADIPVLERVGNPVCISPDKGLRKEAMKRGWQIIS